MALSTSEIVLRLLFAFLAGLVVGMERGTRGRPAGMRTLILVCLASALAMILSQVLLAETAYSRFADAVRADPARLGAGILTGIGFLGAATIIRHENVVRGVTTAASLWVIAVLGLVFGSGHFLLGFLGTCVVLIALVLLPRLESLLPSDRYATLTVITQSQSISIEDLKVRLAGLGAHVIHVNLHEDLESRRTTAAFELRGNKNRMFALATEILAELRQKEGVRSVDWQ
jgi:putative Mg2+ transporter-C (MgtC) family protein